MSPRRRKTPPDGRVNNGGARQGQPNRTYSNRSDLRTQAVQAGPSAGYGQRAAQERAQQAVPLPQQPGPPPPGQVTPEMLAGISTSATPTFGQPSARPDEPITAGMSFGPGRTPQPGARPRDFASEENIDRLRAIYLRHPTPELAELLDQTWIS